MSTALANPTEMIRQGAPRLIHSDEELAEYTEALFELTAKPDPTPDEEEAIELMTLLIERYERSATRCRRPSLPMCCAFCSSKMDSRSATLPRSWEAKALSRWFSPASGN